MEMEDFERIVGRTEKCSLKTTTKMAWGKGEDVEDLHVLSPSSILEFIHMCSYKFLKNNVGYNMIPVILDIDMRFISPTPVGMMVIVEITVEKVERNVITISFKVFDELEKVAEGRMRSIIVSKGYLRRRIDEKTSQFV